MIIHLGWVGREPPPDSVLAAVESARTASPGSEVMFHADEGDVPAKWREAMDALNLRPHMRSDVQRHAVLKRHGGLWLDADVRLLADPAEWTAGWDRYTAIRLYEGPSMIGTDIIYVPAGWDGWSVIDDEIDRVLAKTAETRRVSVLGLAHRMILNCAAKRPEAFQILGPEGKFPFGAENHSVEAVVARGFDPATTTPKPRRAMGLGDMAAAALGAVGITEERVSRLIGRPCGCGRRREAMNALGRRLGIG